jgi:hypothetical protein
MYQRKGHVLKEKYSASNVTSRRYPQEKVATNSWVAKINIRYIVVIVTKQDHKEGH